MAEKTYDDLQNDIAAKINDNSAREISEQDVRESLQDTADSCWHRWRPSNNYSIGDHAFHPTSNRLLQCIEADNDATFSASKWSEVTQFENHIYDLDDSTYYYYGKHVVGNNTIWIITRVERDDSTQVTTANSGAADLDAAWAIRGTLTYS